jgi:hypothetical protein
MMNLVRIFSLFYDEFAPFLPGILKILPGIGGLYLFDTEAPKFKNSGSLRPRISLLSAPLGPMGGAEMGQQKTRPKSRV